ncbi:hypothetical protein B9Y74_05515 [Stenotrophomonas maltophilia]|uniref:hypothetical protein n=1 Tax=Stenotrophomonas maltophilia TaxID=40324 RepID=UPI000C262A5F|nr:hypothetical protein [Stenotrophomonas maltophilia]PJL51454.1 hypothetical protein B9Y74_05515 [Stenotrophomonas maltophilia]
MSDIQRYEMGRHPYDRDISMIFDNYGNYVSYDDHEAEVARLRAEADALRVDAKRYRWLRDQAAWSDAKNPCPYSEKDGQLRCITSGLDAAIDAAMGADA